MGNLIYIGMGNNKKLKLPYIDIKLYFGSIELSSEIYGGQNLIFKKYMV